MRCLGAAVQRDNASLAYEGVPGAMIIGLRPEHLRFGSSGLNGRIAQIEPMGREILYVVDTDIGYLRVIEQGSAAPHGAREAVNIGFSPEHSLVFDATTARLVDMINR
jgi:inositol-phosphate transport system ATP-binding protein